MADLVTVDPEIITKVNLPLAQAGEPLVDGDILYLKISDKKFYKAFCNGTPEEATVAGICYGTAAINNHVATLLQRDSKIIISTVMAIGQIYVLSENPGKAKLQSDLVATQILSMLWVAETAAIAKLIMDSTGIVTP